jgi:hypothetical protein
MQLLIARACPPTGHKPLTSSAKGSDLLICLLLPTFLLVNIVFRLCKHNSARNVRTSGMAWQQIR